jgi:hypothetical protein
MPESRHDMPTMAMSPDSSRLVEDRVFDMFEVERVYCSLKAE